MITPLSAADTLALIHDDLGRPHIAVVDPKRGPRALRVAITEAASRSGTCIVAMLIGSPSQVAVVDTWLMRIPHAERQLIEVEDGLLLLVTVQGTPRREVCSKASTTPWSTPDAAAVRGATEADLNDDALREILRAFEPSQRRTVGARGSNEERYLASCGLLTHDGEIWCPTVAAMALCGHRPELFLPGCRLLGDIDGNTIEHTGTIPKILRGFMGGLPRGVDAHIIAEVVLNAFLHRDWSADAPVFVYLSGDRLEVTNPGAISKGSTPNPLLLLLTRTLDLSSGKGGLLDVGRRLARHRRRPFSLFERDGVVHFVAELRRKTRPSRRPLPKTTRHLPPAPTTPSTSASWPDLSPPTPPAEPPPHTPPVLVSVPPPLPVQPRRVVPALLPRDANDRADAVLAALATRGNASTKELAADLGCSRPVIGKVLKVLVDEGRVRPLLASNRSPFQRYAIANP